MVRPWDYEPAHYSLFGDNVEIKPEGPFLSHFDRVLTLAVPIGWDFRFWGWRQPVAGHVAGRHRWRGNKIFDGHAIFAEEHTLVCGNRITSGGDRAAALQTAFEQRMKFDVALIERRAVERDAAGERLAAARIFRAAAETECQGSAADGG